MKDKRCPKEKLSLRMQFKRVLVTYVIIVILFLWLQDDPSFTYITVNGLSIDVQCAGNAYLTANGVFESHHDVWPLFKVWKGWQVIQNKQLSFFDKKIFSIFRKYWIEELNDVVIFCFCTMIWNYFTSNLIIYTLWSFKVGNQCLFIFKKLN